MAAGIWFAEVTLEIPVSAVPSAGEMRALSIVVPQPSKKKRPCGSMAMLRPPGNGVTGRAAKPEHTGDGIDGIDVCARVLHSHRGIQAEPDIKMKALGVGRVADWQRRSNTH